uniref:Uncharacterized protein n=1 Tax=Haemonchus contortus TaxID=6289 RepID=W6NBW6_HAECO
MKHLNCFHLVFGYPYPKVVSTRYSFGSESCRVDMSPLLLVSKNKLIWCSVLAFYVLLAEAIQCYTDDQTEQEMAATGYQTCSSYYNFKRKGRRILVTGEGFTGSSKKSTSPVFCEVYDHGDRGRAQLVIDDREAKIAGIKKGSANCYCNTSFICHTQAETFKNYISRAGPEEKRILKHFLKKRAAVSDSNIISSSHPITSLSEATASVALSSEGASASVAASTTITTTTTTTITEASKNESVTTEASTSETTITSMAPGSEAVTENSGPTGDPETVTSGPIGHPESVTSEEQQLERGIADDTETTTVRFEIHSHLRRDRSATSF